MCHVHLLSTEMKDENLNRVPKRTLRNNNQASLTIKLWDSKDYCMIYGDICQL